jgi:hypothetical protein
MAAMAARVAAARRRAVLVVAEATDSTAATLVPAAQEVQPLARRELRPVAQVAQVAPSLRALETPARVALAATQPALAVQRVPLVAWAVVAETVRPSAAMVELAVPRY